MLQFLTEFLLWVNVPWTILLVLAGAYWLLTSIGAVEIRGLDPEISDELRVGVRGGSPEPGNRRGLAKFLSNFLKFIHYGQAPLIFIITIFSGTGLVFSVLGNYFLDFDKSIAAGSGWALLSFLVAVTVENMSVRPIAKFFRNRNYESRDIREVIGMRGVVRSLECTERTGRLEIKKLRGGPMFVEARTEADQPLKKGDTAYIIRHDKDRAAFVVSAIDPAAPFDYSASEAELVTEKVH